MTEPKDSIRINKFFTENGLCSRREADRMIGEGRVGINGRTAKLGDQVLKDDKVSVDGKVILLGVKKSIILAYNKPAGIECTSDPKVPENIIDAIGYPERIFHIGRLDKFSEGLILLTNRGEIVNRILRAHFEHEKEYVVDLNGPIDDLSMRRLREGIMVLGRMTLPCGIERLGKARIRMILTEGRNRQIRRMIEEVGLRVSRLRRVRIMHVELGELPKGTWRLLNAKETRELEKRIGPAQTKDAKKENEEPDPKLRDETWE